VVPGLTPVPQGTQRSRLRLLDTWEWSLWHADRVLLGTSHGVALHRRTTVGSDPPLEELLGISDPPPFDWDWPGSRLADALAPLTQLRALIPVARLTRTSHRFDLRNSDDKTVARLLLQEWTGDGGELRCAQVLPIRGYAEEVEAVQLALARAGVEPRKWTVKPDFGLSQELPAGEAAARILRRLLPLGRETELGLCDDVDTEFLHDYRICVRKARSVLSVFKKAIDPVLLVDLKARYRTLGSRTNRLRDLDVHLLGWDRQVQRVPPDLQAGLDELHADIVAQRSGEHRRLRRHLRSQRYHAEIAALEELLARLPGEARHADTPTRQLADQLLWRSFRTLQRGGAALTPASPDEHVHDLRIEGKKLRYLAEFFGPLYPPQLKALLKRLKQLQDVLGEFNDACVQQDSLRAWLQQRREAGTLSAEAATSVGALLGALYTEQGAMRARVDEHLGVFAEQEPAARLLFSVEAL
jgi:CHAD domain-containing protein